MKADPRSRPGVLAAASWLAAALAAGCAHTAAAPRPSDTDAAEAARRAERVKVMQEFWEEETARPAARPGAAASAAAPLDYPAGAYSGINFAPREAADPSMAEPRR
jgi:hypothetical protein